MKTTHAPDRSVIAGLQADPTCRRISRPDSSAAVAEANFCECCQSGDSLTYHGFAVRGQPHDVTRCNRCGDEQEF